MLKIGKKRHWCKLFALCLAFAMSIGVLNGGQPVHAATKEYHTDKYYKNKKTVTSTKTTTTYGAMCYYAKYKERTITKKTTKTVTVYYKHTKKVTTTNTTKSTKEKSNYSTRQPKITDVKSMIPSSVYQSWQKSGFSIIQNPADDSFKDIHTSGVFTLKKKAIILREYSADQETLLHELGHFVDWMNDKCSETSSFKSIFQSESKNMASGSYGRTSATEYFAECFKMYCKDKSGFQKKYPKTYKCINTAIQNL